MDAACTIQDSIHVFSLVHKYVSRILGTYHDIETGLTSFLIYFLEIYFRVIVTAFQQFFHFFLTWLSWVGAGAGIQNCIGCNLRQSL